MVYNNYKYIYKYYIKYKMGCFFTKKKNIFISDDIKNVKCVPIMRDKRLDNKKDDEFCNIKKTKLYENLIFEGGSTKSIAYLGAIQELHNINVLKNIKRFGGTSSGSIVATLLALDYTIDELIVEIENINLEHLIDDKIGFIRDGINFLTNYGVAPGKKLIEVMERYIKKKTNNDNMTFKELYEYNNKELHIIVSNISKSCKEICNHLNTPNMPISLAVRMSSSIPIIYEPEKYNNCYYVDGGLYDNFPLDIFDENCDTINCSTLGLKLMTLDEQKNNVKEINNVIEYLTKIVNSTNEYIEKKEIKAGDYYRTINIIVPNINFYDFNITNEQKTELIKCGKNAVINFFK